MAKRPKKGPPAQPPGPPKELKQSPFAALAGLTVTAADRVYEPEPVKEATTERRPPAPAPAAPPERDQKFAPKVVARREKKGRGGKTVTRISGVLADHAPALAKRMKKSLGCGASLDGADIILHGSLVERAAKWLEGEGARQVVRAN